MKIERLGKEVSYALRHNPMAYGLNLDENGFCLIEDLLNAINEKNNYNRIIVKTDLEEMMSKATKKRFEIVNDKIRALYGHSFNKLIIHEEVSVPNVLYHGDSDTDYLFRFIKKDPIRYDLTNDEFLVRLSDYYSNKDDSRSLSFEDWNSLHDWNNRKNKK